MGEVYRARDAKLKREVALKVLPPDVAGDHQRLARFQREAELLATLNHPHIAQLYGIEETTGTTALVMELVEGEDLAQWIARGAIPLGEALPIAKQITEALAAAHDAGIVHRDLKPANIKVRSDGTVKVLDFGLAKSLDVNTVSGTQPSDHAPTLTSPAMTMGGMVLGTAAYMAPEQARGRAVDKRADIWAFGCVFYEMVTGERAFRGDGMTDLLASVVRDQPDLAKAPSSVRRLLQKCLEKEPRHRLRDLGDAWELVDDGAQRVSAPVPRIARLPWAVAALLALVAATLGIVAVRRQLRRIPFLGGTSRRLVDGVHSPIGWSPDGKRFAFLRLNDPRESGRRGASLVTAASDGSDERIIATREPPYRWYTFGLPSARVTAPAWSPDGSLIALRGNERSPDGRTKQHVAIVAAATGEIRLVPLPLRVKVEWPGSTPIDCC